MKKLIFSFISVALLIGLSTSAFCQDYEFVLKWGEFGTGDGQFNFPTGVAVDSNDNVYVSDYYNHRVQKFDSNGNFITKWGTLGSGDGQFFVETDITVDLNGNVFVLDSGNSRVQKFDSVDGINYAYVSQWGSPGSGDGEFSGTHGITVDTVGNVYVADCSNHRVQKFDSNGNFITKWGSYGLGDGEFNLLLDVAVDSAGNVYVADARNHRIQKFAVHNTPPGDDVVAIPEDPDSGEAPVTLTFDEVTVGGETSLTISDTGPPPTTGFKLGNPPLFYEIETTAEYSGPIDICIDYKGISFDGPEENLMLSHQELNGDWIDITTSVDTENNIICGSIYSLSTFAVFESMTLEDLIQMVQASSIDMGVRTSLVQKLQNSQKSLEKGNINAAINQIMAFQNEVHAQSSKKIPGNLADEWVEISEVIMASL